ncbi:MAG: hypothetical protein WB771_14930 [Solirubrobacterales bacterium]
MKHWKIQKFLGDLVYDLRSRNLLPIVILLAVAIVAVPILVTSSGSSSSPGTVGVGAATPSNAALQNQAAVVSYDPGVRNFKHRLRELSSKDPFKQQFVPPPAGTSSAGQGTSATGTSSGLPSTGSTGSGNTTTGGSGNGKTKTKTKTKTQTVTYRTDVLIGESGGTLAQVSNLQQFQFLPSPDKPILVYMGTTSAGSQAIFLLSKDVSSVGGNGTCFPTADSCQLLGLNPGAGADLIYAPDGKTYHLQVTRIKRFTK